MSNRIQVFLFAQNPTTEIPTHQASHLFAAQLVASKIARWVDSVKRKIQLLTRESWAQVKNRFRKVAVGVPVLKPVREPECLMLSYPPQHQESDGKRRQEELWMRAVKF